MARKRTGNPPGRPKGYPAFARMERAREALANHAEDAVKLMHKAAKVAAERGNHAPSAWMLEHMVAKDDKGAEVRPIGAGIDKQAIEQGSRAPTINIGWVVPGALPSSPSQPIIDVTPQVAALPEHTESEEI